MLEVGTYGPWAVLAGDSEGAGAEFAKQLAADGFDLVLIAREHALRHAGATVATCSVRAHSLAHHVEQLSTLQDLANDEKGIGS